MLINHKYKFIFLKTRKTAGTSIEIALSRFCEKKDTITEIVSENAQTKEKYGYLGERNYYLPLGHCTKKDILKIPLHGWPKFSEHSTASYVRDRIDRDIWNSYFKFSFERNPFDRFLSQYHWNTRTNKRDIYEYADNAEPYRLSNWEVYTIRDKLAVDFVGKYENLESDLDEIRQRLSLPDPIVLPETKTGLRPKSQHYSDVLDEYLIDRISLVCAKEIRTFGYTF